MSNLLNIKDQNGNWIPIPVVTNGIQSIIQNQDYTLTITLNDGTTYTTTSIKGEDGQDYVLTENDKQEIAQEIAEMIDTDMVVTFTIPWVNGDFGEGGTADKTFTEIKTAVLEGKHVIGKLYITANNMSQFLTTLPIVTNSADAGDIITFSTYYSFGHSSDFKTINTVMTVFIISDGTDDTIIAKRTKEIATEEYVGERINAIPDAPVEDVQVNGTSIVNGGVAEIPKASFNDFGVVKTGNDYGISILSNGRITVYKADDAQIKSSEGIYRPIVPSNQHESAFYGLAKAAGDITQSSSSNTVGTYTDEAKTAIKQMLDVKDDYDSLVVEVSGTDPVITGKPSYRYNCGELYTLSITPPASGTMDIIFTSGTTPTVLSLPNTVKMPDWWVGIETNTTYEMCITDGVYCGVMSWAT